MKSHHIISCMIYFLLLIHVLLNTSVIKMYVRYKDNHTDAVTLGLDICYSKLSFSESIAVIIIR